MDPTNTSPPLPPTLSHSDMARPPHEDPEYQRKIVGNMRQGLLMSSASGQAFIKSSVPMTGSNTVIHNYAAWSQTSPVSHNNGELFIDILLSIVTDNRILHKSTSDCHHDRPHHTHHIHRQRTLKPITPFWCNNTIRCHRKDQSQNYLIARHPNCRHPHNKTRRCFTHPPR